mmetsp:Transcript_43251/g.102915  ORF Transcript_43251/g.102915 Transcript_43251/m.102915 type:complete len:225 (+) Transcript_43251:596-1270(+)
MEGGRWAVDDGAPEVRGRGGLQGAAGDLLPETPAPEAFPPDHPPRNAAGPPHTGRAAGVDEPHSGRAAAVGFGGDRSLRRACGPGGGAGSQGAAVRVARGADRGGGAGAADVVGADVRGIQLGAAQEGARGVHHHPPRGALRDLQAVQGHAAKQGVPRRGEPGDHRQGPQGRELRRDGCAILHPGQERGAHVLARQGRRSQLPVRGAGGGGGPGRRHLGAELLS